MQDRTRRDEKTMQIFTSLLVFVGALMGGSLLLVLADRTMGLAEDVGSKLFLDVAVAAAGLAIAYLVRRDHHP